MSHSSDPLVSVMMPCYNCADTLPFALASLLCQSYENWECLLVDDGSTDNPKRIVDAIDDKRIRFFQFEANRGRPAARQHALEQAQGEFLCMLDADDWLFPGKIATQVGVFWEEPTLAMVSTGMSVVNEQNQLVGVQARGSEVRRVKGPWNTLSMPPFPHGPTMLRTKLAKEHSYDLRLERSQDVDFLMRALQGKYYMVLPDISYVYLQVRSRNIRKQTFTALRCTASIFKKYLSDRPIASLAELAKLQAKKAIYFCAFALGLDQLMVSRRFEKPTDGDFTIYERAHREVQQSVEAIFPARQVKDRSSAASIQ